MLIRHYLLLVFDKGYDIGKQNHLSWFSLIQKYL